MHSLRHTFGPYIGKRGTKLRVVQEVRAHPPQDHLHLTTVLRGLCRRPLVSVSRPASAQVRGLLPILVTEFCISLLLYVQLACEEMDRLSAPVVLPRQRDPNVTDLGAAVEPLHGHAGLRDDELEYPSELDGIPAATTAGHVIL